MHTLVVCQRGNVRSVTVACILRDLYGEKDVLAIGIETTTLDTEIMLVQWADVVLIAGEVNLGDSWLGTRPAKRIFFLEGIGRDIWGQPMHPDLVAKAINAIEKTGVYTIGDFYAGSNIYLYANRVAYERRGLNE